MPVEVERRIRDASCRGAADPGEDPGRATAAPSALEPGAQRELNAPAAHGALALPEPGEAQLVPTGMAIHVYACNQSMGDKAMCNSDGDFLSCRSRAL